MELHGISLGLMLGSPKQFHQDPSVMLLAVYPPWFSHQDPLYVVAMLVVYPNDYPIFQIFQIKVQRHKWFSFKNHQAMDFPSLQRLVFRRKNQQLAGKLKSSATRPEMIWTIHHMSPSFQWCHGPFAHSSKWHLQISGLHPMDVLWNHWTNQRKMNHPWFSSDG